MTQKETASVLALLRAAYPSFYRNLNESVMNDVLSLWYEMFRGEDIRIVKAALRRLIATHTGYPPDIAAVGKYIAETEAILNGEPTDEELWSLFVDACSDGIYHADARFAELPGILQRYAGNPGRIAELARTPFDSMNTIVRERFFRAMPSLRERVRCENAIRAGTAGNGFLTPAEKEERVGRLLAALGDPQNASAFPAPNRSDGNGKGKELRR